MKHLVIIFYLSLMHLLKRYAQLTMTLTNEAQEEEKDEEKDGGVYSAPILFDIVENNVIASELLKQKEFIKNLIVEIEINMLDAWNKLKSFKEMNIGKDLIIRQNYVCIESENENQNESINIMSQYGIKSKYVNQNELTKSAPHEFDGSVEYDENKFLTSLLIRSHLIHSKFQRDCKKIFGNENMIGVNNNKREYVFAILFFCVCLYILA